MKKPIKKSVRTFSAQTLKPILVDMSVAVDSKESLRLEMIDSAGSIIKAPVYVNRDMAQRIGTQEDWVGKLASNHDVKFIVHVDDGDVVTAIDTYPSGQYSMGLFPTVVKDLTTITVLVDMRDGSLSVPLLKDDHGGKAPAAAPYIVPTFYPSLYRTLDGIGVDDLVVDMELPRGLGYIQAIEGQKIIIEVPKPV